MAESLKQLLVGRVGEEAAARLARAVVGVAGLGGLGSLATILLARAGVGRLVLVDFDVVEAVNLHRQHYRLGDVGRPKTEALADILAGINPDPAVETREITLTEANAAEVFADCGLILECLDRAEAKAMLLSVMSEKSPETFVIAASGLAGYGKSEMMKTVQLAERLFVVGDLVSSAGPGNPLHAPRVGLAACLQANLALSLILDGKVDGRLGGET